MLYVDRNQALGFARRARNNLRCIEQARKGGDCDAHEVTQVALSIVGMVVFPYERNVVSRLHKESLTVLAQQGWPTWRITQGSAESLKDIVHHLRNATAHGRLSFSSDARDPSEVMLTIEDAKAKDSPVYWAAEISVKELKEFCLRFLEVVEEATS